LFSKTLLIRKSLLYLHQFASQTRKILKPGHYPSPTGIILRQQALSFANRHYPSPTGIILRQRALSFANGQVVFRLWGSLKDKRITDLEHAFRKAMAVAIAALYQLLSDFNR
jgi:hypothetical protein